MLGNLPPWLRSKVNSTQLAVIVKKSFINKYKMHSILKPLVDDVKKTGKSRIMNVIYILLTQDTFKINT